MNDPIFCDPVGWWVEQNCPKSSWSSSSLRWFVLSFQACYSGTTLTTTLDCSVRPTKPTGQSQEIGAAITQKQQQKSLAKEVSTISAISHTVISHQSTVTSCFLARVSLQYEPSNAQNPRTRSGRCQAGLGPPDAPESRSTTIIRSELVHLFPNPPQPYTAILYH